MSCNLIRPFAFVVYALLALASHLGADEPRRDDLWCRYRGPSHGRAHLADAPGPPLTLKWTIDLSKFNPTLAPDNSILFGRKRPFEFSPAGLGIAWRMDQDFLYAFEIGFYTSGKRVAVFDRRTGEFLGRTSDGKSQPLANKRVVSIHDDPGFGTPFVFYGNFYSGQRLFGIDSGGSLSPLDLTQINMRKKIAGHACEGPRWLQGRFYLNGGGAWIDAGASYRWGSHLVRWGPDEHQVVLRDVSVPCAVWDHDQLILFTRGGLSGHRPDAVFSWQEYIKVGVEDDRGVILARRRVTNRDNPTGEDLFEDPMPTSDDQRMTNRARNAVNAMAISVDGQFVYCQERVTAGEQRIVRRKIDDFSIDGVIPSAILPPVREQSTFGHANLELGVGMAVDDQHFYLHLVDRVVALSLDLRTIAWSAKLPPRQLDGHCAFSMNRYLPKSNQQYACRGTENTLAVSGRHLYLTTDSSLQVHSTATGEKLWSYEFNSLPRFSELVTHPHTKAMTRLKAFGYPGDILLADDAVYVSTHGNQSHLYCFVRSDTLPSQ
ncbi:hypothetical protein [Stieleria maiorica]|nr:hypothetical protein [Stieleria maiorica]